MDITTIYDDLIELMQAIHADLLRASLDSLAALDAGSTLMESDYLTVIENLKVDRAHYLQKPESKESPND